MYHRKCGLGTNVFYKKDYVVALYYFKGKVNIDGQDKKSLSFSILDLSFL